MYDEWTIDYYPDELTAVFQDCIWHEIWRPFPGLKCVATAAEFTFYTNEDGTTHYFTIEREEED